MSKNEELSKKYNFICENNLYRNEAKVENTVLIMISHMLELKSKVMEMKGRNPQKRIKKNNDYCNSGGNKKKSFVFICK